MLFVACSSRSVSRDWSDRIGSDWIAPSFPTRPRSTLVPPFSPIVPTDREPGTGYDYWGLPSKLIRREKGAFRKLSSNRRNLEYVRFALNVASKTYWKQTFSNTWLPCSYVSLVISLGFPSFPLKRVSKMNAKFCVFIFLQRSVAAGQKQESCQSSWTTLTIIL